ncbi:diguanylate cyclase domain-containing protein [Clostridium butyricum]
MYAFSCNKSVFFTQVEKYLKQNKNTKCALIFLDLDNFKFINDNFGHLTGDNVNSLINKADIALYNSKQNGKNKYTFFNESIIGE